MVKAVKKNKKLSKRTAVTGVVLAVVLPPIGFIWSLYLLVRSKKPEVKDLSIKMLVASMVFFVPFYLLINMGIDTYYNVAYPDTAADKISPVTKAIEEMSSTERLCKGSFNGHSRSGIGRPKAYANYFVQDTPDLSQKISADAKSAGLELHQDPDNSNKQYNWRLRSYDASKNEFLSSSSEMQPFKFEDEYLLVEIVRADRIGNPCSIGVVDVPAGKAYVSLDYESKKP